MNFRIIKINKHGFTLVEVLLVVGILSLIAGLGAPFYGSLQNKNEINVDTNSVVQDLYQAQSLSRSESHDCGWGVAINGQVVTLFCGTNYSSRNSVYDSTYTIPSAISISGLSEIDYTKLYGLPESTGSIILTSNSTSDTIIVNAKGMIEY